jgi:hypothetical protein
MATALALARLLAAERLAGQLLAAAAAAIDAVRAPLDPTTRRSAAWPATRCSPPCSTASAGR